MKTFKFILFAAVASVILVVTACKKTENTPVATDFLNEITGSYSGSYTLDDGLKTTNPANAEVNYVGGTEVEVHCYGEMLDTTFVMDIYANNDSIMLCATGDDFEHMYGHPQGDHHMDHMGDGQTEWMHHMQDEHGDGDRHYGGFNMNNHTLGYTFNVDLDNEATTIVFEGARQE